MPLWKIYHPAGAFTAEDKKALSRQVTGIYARIPIPRFYVVTIFEEIERDSLFVGGEPHNKFIRIQDRSHRKNIAWTDRQRVVDENA